MQQLVLTLDVVILLKYTIGFGLVYLLSVQLFSRTTPNFQKQKAHLAASRVMSTCHSFLVVPYCVMDLAPHSFPFAQLYATQNTVTQVLVLHISMAYFLVDFAHCMLFERDDLLFLVHHSISILFYISVQRVGRGGYSMMMAIFLGEVTNPLQSLWYLAKLGGYTRAYAALSPLFTLAFVVVRCVILPVEVADIFIGYFASPQSELIPPQYSACWFAMCGVMTIGGWVWSFKLIRGFLKKWRGDGEASKKSSVSVSSSPLSSPEFTESRAKDSKKAV